MTLTAKDVAEIARLLEDSHFDELTLELDDLKLSLRRNGAAALPAAPRASAREGPAAGPISAGPSAEATSPGGALSGGSSPPGTAPAGNPAPVTAGGTAQDVAAPLLGTFYRAPKPGAPPYVEVGSAVAEDTIVGIIEVMKLMNTVRAGACGTVVEILAQDGSLVEYGQTLLRVSRES